MSSVRSLAFAGLMLAGCATTQVASAPGTPANRMAVQVEACQKARKTRVQDCIVEAFAAGCRSYKDQDKFYTCVSEDLSSQPLAESRRISAVISKGDEMLSVREGGYALMDVASLETTKIDKDGVEFLFTIDRINTLDLSRSNLEKSMIRINFDGTASEEIWKLDVLRVWGLLAEAAPDGKARVSFETSDPTLLSKP